MDMDIEMPFFNETVDISEPTMADSPVVSDPEDKLLVYIPPKQAVPSFGFTNIVFSKTSVASATPIEGFSETQTEFIFQNASLVLKISKESGNITHLSLSPGTANLLGSTGIHYSLHTIQHPRSRQRKSGVGPSSVKPPVLLPRNPLQLDSIEVIERGPLRFTFLIKYLPTKAHTFISTRISIYHQSHKIYGETLVELNDPDLLLGLEIDTPLSPQEIHCGGPYCVHHHSVPTTSTYFTPIVEIPFQEFVYWSSDQTIGEMGTVAVYFQTKFGLGVSESGPRFHLVASKSLPRPDAALTYSDPDVKSRKNGSDHGYQRIPWAIEFLPPKVAASTIIRSAREFNTPFILAPTHAVHDTLSFFSLDAANVMMVSVKEIEEFMREAPDWFYHPTMAELAFVIQCVELDGLETACSLQIDSKLTLKQAMEVDFIERISNNDIQNSDVMLLGHTVTFTIRPHEIKSIMVSGRIILEQE